MNTPNLLLITFDQMRADWLELENNNIKAPNLKNLANKGWQSKRCYTNSPQCMPARFSWLTGLRCSQIGLTKNGPYSLLGGSPSFARDLKNRGWHTAVIGKTHWYSHREKQDLRDKEKIIKELGFEYVEEVAGPRALKNVSCGLTDEWEKAKIWEKQKYDLDMRYRSGEESEAWLVRPSVLPNYLYPDIWICTKAKEYIKEIKKKQPWFLWISFVGPHEPFDTPKPWHGQHDPEKLPKPCESKEWIKALDSKVELKKKSVQWGDKLDTKDIMRLRADYADHINLLDDQVGEIMDTLKTYNQEKNTAIAITSDHGDHLGDYGMLYKGTFMESSIRVPWIYVDPQVEERKKLINETPMELARAFKLMSRNIYCNGGNAQKLKELTERKKIAIVEYSDEILVVKGNKKICLNKEGAILWATKIRGNKETNNINRIKPWKIKKGPWSKLCKIGRRYAERTKRRDWEKKIISEH